MLSLRPIAATLAALAFFAYVPLVAQFNPVLPGDHPDPSVVRIGANDWAANTSGGWGPIFPVFRSSDLRHWRAAGAVFETRPDWADRDFWAPELTDDRGHLRVYYAARKRGGGPLCVAVATTHSPQGPYRDHGTMVCQNDGSIDPAFVRDQDGKPFLVWKEDRNSIHQPSKIWLQPTSEDGLRLSGTATAILTSDAAWEGDVVEGPYILKHGPYFYLFYAGGACCGSHCNYGEGVARATSLLGPWEKNPANPIIAANANWKCPGHGTVVKTPAGEDYLMYHAYPRLNSIFIGRESVLDRVVWNANGWPVVNGGAGVSGTAVNDQASDFTYSFNETHLPLIWQWPVENKPNIQLRHAVLELAPQPSLASDPLGALLGMTARSFFFRATVEVESRQPHTLASIALVGNTGNATGIGVQDGNLVQFERVRDVWTQLAVAALPRGERIFFAIETQGPEHLKTSWSFDGANWQPLGQTLTASSLPPWDSGLRIALACGGSAGARAAFANFHLTTRKQTDQTPSERNTKPPD